MHITATLVSVLATASAVLAQGSTVAKRGADSAAATWGDNNAGNHGGGKAAACGLTAANVKELIDGYTYILVHPGGPDFNKTAARILTDDFSVYSDSINSLAGRPLGGPSFPPGKQNFINSQYQTPPIPQLDTLDVFVGAGKWDVSSASFGNVSCSNLKLSWRWIASGIGSNEYKVKGVIDMDLAPGPKGGVPVGIKTVYSEFNTAAWLRNYGVQCVPPPRK